MSPGQGRKLLPTSRVELGQLWRLCRNSPDVCVSPRDGQEVSSVGGYAGGPGLSLGHFDLPYKSSFERLNMSFQGHKTSHRGIFAPIQIEKIHHSLRKVRRNYRRPNVKAGREWIFYGSPTLYRERKPHSQESLLSCRAIYNHGHSSNSYCR